MTEASPAWRPPRLKPTGLDFTDLAPPGHLIVGCLVREDGGDPMAAASTSLHTPIETRASFVLLAEVLDVGPRCPGINVGDRVLIQRFSGAGKLWDGMSEQTSRGSEDARPSSGLNPDWLGPAVAERLSRFSAIQIVRCANGVRAQDPGIDSALVVTAQVAKWRRDFVREDKGRSPDDPKMVQARRDLLMTEALLKVLLEKRAGKAVNGAILAAGLRTGDDGAAFDGVIAVVEP